MSTTGRGAYNRWMYAFPWLLFSTKIMSLTVDFCIKKEWEQNKSTWDEMRDAKSLSSLCSTSIITGYNGFYKRKEWSRKILKKKIGMILIKTLSCPHCKDVAKNKGSETWWGVDMIDKNETRKTSRGETYHFPSSIMTSGERLRDRETQRQNQLLMFFLWR